MSKSRKDKRHYMEDGKRKVRSPKQDVEDQSRQKWDWRQEIKGEDDDS